MVSATEVFLFQSNPVGTQRIFQKTQSFRLTHTGQFFIKYHKLLGFAVRSPCGKPLIKWIPCLDKVDQIRQYILLQHVILFPKRPPGMGQPSI